MSYKVGIAGFGTIGAAVGRRLVAGMDGLKLEAVASGGREKAQAALAVMGAAGVPVVTPEDLAQRCDIIVECAPTAAFMDIAVPAMMAGRQMVTVSAAALIEHMEGRGPRSRQRRPDHHGDRRSPGIRRRARRGQGRDPFGRHDHAQSRRSRWSVRRTWTCLASTS